MEISNHLRDAGVHMGFGYRMDSIERGLSHNTCTIEKGVAVVNTASTIALATDMAVSRSRC